MNKKTEIKISQQDLKFILGENYQSFTEKIVHNVFCTCGDTLTTTVVDYKIFVNQLDDIVLRGLCKDCRQPVTRYMQTGEVERYRQRVQKVRKEKS
jgi:hypothetical protein